MKLASTFGLSTTLRLVVVTVVQLAAKKHAMATVVRHKQMMFDRQRVIDKTCRWLVEVIVIGLLLQEKFQFGERKRAATTSWRNFVRTNPYLDSGLQAQK